MKTVLAIDPGRDKCGLAVVSEEGTLHRAVVSRADAADIAVSLAARHSTDIIIIGNGTGAKALADEFHDAAVPIELVDETLSSQRARTRYFEENPPKGFRRLIPRGLLTPDHPYDDYVAVILAEDYLKPPHV